MVGLKFYKSTIYVIKLAQLVGFFIEFKHQFIRINEIPNYILQWFYKCLQIYPTEEQKKVKLK